MQRAGNTTSADRRVVPDMRPAPPAEATRRRSGVGSSQWTLCRRTSTHSKTTRRCRTPQIVGIMPLMLHGRGSLALATLGLLAVSVPRARAQEQPPLAVVVDPHMMAASGAIDLLGAQHVVTTVEDRWLPPRRFDESTPVTRTLGIAYRFAK